MTKGKYNINSWFGFLAIILLSTLFHASSNKAFANVGVSNTYHTTTHLDINFEQTRANHISTLFEVVNLNKQKVKEDLELLQVIDLLINKKTKLLQENILTIQQMY